MAETLVFCGLAALAGGIVVGQLRLLWLLVHLATAGAAALVAFTLQSELGLGVDIVPATGSVELAALVFLEVVVVATIGWYLARSED
jgi:hypothetical protein